MSKGSSMNAIRFAGKTFLPYRAALTTGATRGRKPTKSLRRKKIITTKQVNKPLYNSDFA